MLPQARTKVKEVVLEEFSNLFVTYDARRPTNTILMTISGGEKKRSEIYESIFLACSNQISMKICTCHVLSVFSSV